MPTDHQSRLDAILTRSAPDTPLHRRFAGVTDEFWFWLFTEGYRANEPTLHGLLPRMPPEAVQLQFTGAAGDRTLADAFRFYQLVRALCRRHSGVDVETVVDFGCGWGRIIRFFLRDVDPRHLVGIDCYPEAIEQCRATNALCRFEVVSPFPPTYIAEGSVDLVYSFSVFSHLSEAAHLAWLAEFDRLLRPGGLVVATTRSRDFILMCAELRRQQDRRAWAYSAAASFLDTADALARYDRGEFLHEATGGGGVLDKSFFGETCIPRPYVETRWGQRFDVLDFIDDPEIYGQSIAVVRKRVH